MSNYRSAVDALRDEAVRASIALGELSLDQAAQETGWPIVEDGWRRLLAPNPETVWAHDGQGDEIDYPGYDHDEVAQKYVDRAGWGEPSPVTVWTCRMGIRPDGRRKRYDERRHVIERLQA